MMEKCDVLNSLQSVEPLDMRLKQEETSKVEEGKRETTLFVTVLFFN